MSGNRAQHKKPRKTNGGTMKRLPYLISLTLFASQFVNSVLAHDQPDDPVADFVMTDWMILSSLFGFVIPALLVSVVAWRRGYFRNLEGEAKTYFLTPESDFETSPWDWEHPPAWAKGEAK